MEDYLPASPLGVSETKISTDKPVRWREANDAMTIMGDDNTVTDNGTDIDPEIENPITAPRRHWQPTPFAKQFALPLSLPPSGANDPLREQQTSSQEPTSESKKTGRRPPPVATKKKPKKNSQMEDYLPTSPGRSSETKMTTSKSVLQREVNDALTMGDDNTVADNGTDNHDPESDHAITPRRAQTTRPVSQSLSLSQPAKTYTLRRQRTSFDNYDHLDGIGNATHKSSLAEYESLKTEEAASDGVKTSQGPPQVATMFSSTNDQTQASQRNSQMEDYVPASLDGSSKTGATTIKPVSHETMGNEDNTAKYNGNDSGEDDDSDDEDIEHRDSESDVEDVSSDDDDDSVIGYPTPPQEFAPFQHHPLSGQRTSIGNYDDLGTGSATHESTPAFQGPPQVATMFLATTEQKKEPQKSSEMEDYLPASLGNSSKTKTTTIEQVEQEVIEVVTIGGDDNIAVHTGHRDNDSDIEDGGSMYNPANEYPTQKLRWYPTPLGRGAGYALSVSPPVLHHPLAEQPTSFDKYGDLKGTGSAIHTSSLAVDQPLNVEEGTPDSEQHGQGPSPEAAMFSSTEEQKEDEFLPWDAPASTNVLEEFDCQACCKSTLSVLKILTYIVVFAFVAFLTLFSNGALLLATSNLRPTTNYKSDQGALRCTGSQSSPSCISLPRNKSGEYSVSGSTCLSSSGNLWAANECSVHRAMWGWSLFMMVCMPYAFVFLRNLKRITRGKYRKPVTWRTLGIVLVVETLYAVGMSLFVFVVLPSVDNVIEGLLVMYGMSLGPSIMRILFRPQQTVEMDRLTEPENEDPASQSAGCSLLSKLIGCTKLPWVVWFLDMASFASQISVIVVFIVVGAIEGNIPVVWSVPVSLLLVSGRHWENYVDAKPLFDRLGFLPAVARRVKKARRSRIMIQLMASICKIVVTLLMMFFTVGIHIDFIGGSNPYVAAFDLNGKYCTNTNNIISVSSDNISAMKLDWLWVWLIQVFSALACYFFVRSAAKMRIQRLCYALPLNLAPPIAYIILASMCGAWNSKPCVFTGTFPGYLFFKCYKDDDPLIYSLWLIMLVLWSFSQLWTTRHVWREPVNRLTPADRLFVLPLYDVIVGQSLLINYTTKVKVKKSTNEIPAVLKVMSDQARPSGVSLIELDLTNEVQRELIPMIYICATMWHETKDEMITMLKSIFKLDWDQWCKEKSVMSLQAYNIPDYYQFEAHIFFDDAMKPPNAKCQHETVNDFVQLFVDVIDEAASKVHNVDLRLRPPVKIPTPYGGRLVWKLPGNNTLTVHLKDSAKIRHKKRWSQVMYMYYFLGHRLLQNEDISGPRKKVRAENTFLLALDGDVDFEPKALMLLVDLMKRDLRVGAACGRIHPTGSGPMVWYQSFEYALGHWMQKATEHVIGCVLCSPGCFSLFRGAAVLDDNVMHKYTTKASEPRHYIQYDQGEDRWLCTLLLQRGYRVEYCAASDSFTQAPEDFKEFFNQRRRWIPSTMANIADLVFSWRHTTVVNENVSIPYIAYQFVMLLASVIGPGTIFMMLVGAMQLALDKFGFPLWASMLVNLVPVVIFVVLCFYAKSDTQTSFASILAYAYCIIQMLVLVGLLVPMAQTPGAIYCNVNAMFFLLVAGSFILCGILHPQEIISLFHGFTYYLAIPTMYLILMIYAVCNLNNVSWGTREVKQTPTELSAEQTKQKAEEMEMLKADKSASGYLASVYSFFGFQSKESNGSQGGCCQRTFGCCCPPPPTSMAADQALTVQLVGEVRAVKTLVKRYSRRVTVGLLHRSGEVPVEMMQLLESSSESDGEAEQETKQLVDDKHATKQVTSTSEHRHAAASEPPVKASSSSTSNVHHQQFSRSTTKSWCDVATLGRGDVDKLPAAETEFFKGLIKKYLEPLLENKQDKEKLEIELRELRNKSALAFLLINGVFIAMLFVLQSYTEELGIPWLPGVCPNNIKIDPLGFTFIILFGTIIIVQTLGMIVHRLGTFQHIMSITDVRTPVGQDVVEITSALGNLEDPELLYDSVDSPDIEYGGDDDDDEDDRKKPTRRKHTRKSSSAPVEPRADENFEKRLNAIKEHPDDESVAKITGILKNRRSTTYLRQAIGVPEPRKSVPARRFGRFGSRRRSASAAHYEEPFPQDTDRRRSVRFADDRGVGEHTVVHDQRAGDGVYENDQNGSEAAGRNNSVTDMRAGEPSQDGPPPPVAGTRARDPSQDGPTPPRQHDQYANADEIYLAPASRFSVDQPIDQDAYEIPRDDDTHYSSPGDSGAPQSALGGGGDGRYAQYSNWDRSARPEDRPSVTLRNRVWQFSNNGYVYDDDE